MNNIKFLICLVTLAAQFTGNSAIAGLIYSDSFDSGSFDSSFWIGNAYTDVTADNPRFGTHSARFTYQGTPDPGDAWAELRFDLGQQYEELSIKFDLFIPSNYVHRNASDGNNHNNKFFRLWHTTYNDIEKIGASLYNQDAFYAADTDISLVGTDYRKQPTWGTSTAVKKAKDLITAADRGKWMSVVIYAKTPTDSSNAIIRIYKNNQLFLEDTPSINHTPGTQGYRYGYILGWANSGFLQNTYIDMDNVQFFDEDVMSAAPLAPQNLNIN